MATVRKTTDILSQSTTCESISFHKSKTQARACTCDTKQVFDGPNVYTYVVQNPWTKFDPLGLITAVYTGKNKETTAAVATFNKSEFASNLPEGTVAVVDAKQGEGSGYQAKSLGGNGAVRIDKNQPLTVTTVDDQGNAGQTNTTLDTILAHEVTHKVHEDFVGETDYAASGGENSVSVEDSALYPNHKEKIAIEGGVLTNEKGETLELGGERAYSREMGYDERGSHFDFEDTKRNLEINREQSTPETEQPIPKNRTPEKEEDE